MARFIAKRIIYTLITIWLISVASFFIIQLPPGDFVSVLMAQAEAEGEQLQSHQIEALRERYSLDQPFPVQYWAWVSGIVTEGDFGYSFQWHRPAAELIWDRMAYTVLLALTSLIFTWIMALGIGVYSAVRRYGVGDYVATTIGFVGLSVPNFVLALTFMYIAFRYFGQSVGGLFSAEYVDAPWSWGRLMDLGSNLIIPVMIIGTAGTAGLIRITRANLIDQLHFPYTIAARARGLPERVLLIRYPVRAALNPFVSTIGWAIPSIVSGEVIVSVVLSLPTTGPLLLNSLRNQDMYLAGSFVLLLGVLTVIGTAISDVLLAWLDPRIRKNQ